MFGCYRRTEAADPGTYVGAIGLVLAHYSSSVVEAVTDPFGGLPARKNDNGYSGLPDVADVKEACEAEATRQLRLTEYRKLPKTNYPRLVAPPESRHGAWANLLLHAAHPHYARFQERTKTADPREWKIDERGLHISYAWLDQPNKAQSPSFQQLSAEDLRKMYPPQEAAE